jgi:hypothetical protein
MDHDKKIERKGGYFVIIPDWVACESQNEKH